MKLTKISKKYEELKIRDMNELEIQGALFYLYKLHKENDEELLGECCTTVEMVQNVTYYCNKHLDIDGAYYIKGFYVSSFFMVEKSYDTLFAVCSDNEEFENHFICRVDLN